MKLFPENKLLKRIEIGVLTALLVLLSYTVAGFLVLPQILKPALTRQFSGMLQREVSFKRIKFNPYLLSVTLKGIDIRGPDTDKRFASFEEIRLDLQASSLFRRAFVFKEIDVRGSRLNIERLEKGRFNLPVLPIATILRLAETGFVIKKIKASNGTVRISDIPQKKEHIIKDVSVTVPRISNLRGERDRWVEIFYEGSFNKSRIRAKVKTKLFSKSLDTLVDLRIKGLRLPYYQSYIPARPGFTLLSGNLDLEANISFSRKEKPDLDVSGSLTVKKLEAVDKRDNQLLKLPYFKLEASSFRPLAGRLLVKGVLLGSPEINLVRERNGKINLLRFFPESKAPQGKEDKPPFFFSIDRIEVRNGRAYFSDFFKKGFSQKAPKPEDTKTKTEKAFQPFFMQAKDIDLTIENLSSARESKAGFSLSFRAEQKGSLFAEGALNINPLSLDLKLTMKDVGISPFEPYLLEGTKVRLTRGSASAKGRIQLKYSKERGLSLSYLGDASLLDLSSIDTVTKSDFIKWKGLEIYDMSVSNKPSFMRIKKAVLKNFFARPEVTKEGKLNIIDILNPKEKAKKSPEKSRLPFESLMIDRVIVEKGHIKFFDNYIQPKFRADMTDIDGIISEISFDAEKIASVDLRGKLDKTTPIEIRGQINPMPENLYANLTVDFKNFDMTSVSPYARKYLGYTIKKGKFSFNAKYVIINKELDSKNRLFFDELTLGEKVESPQATTLPVEMTISLLKNREGEISLEIPVKGKTDDPVFDTVKIVFKTIRGFFSKAAASPFSVLGSIAGVLSEEELRYIEFAPGESSITEQGRDRLDILAKALYERPALELEIEGYVDKEKDREALKQQRLMKKLKEQKLKEEARKGVTLSLEEVKISPKEYPKYLKKTYVQETSENILERIFVENLTRAQMEKILLERIQIKDDDLGALAKERARNVSNYLAEKGKIESKRVFLVKPKTLSPEEKKGLKQSRVNLRLK